MSKKKAQARKSKTTKKKSTPRTVKHEVVVSVQSQPTSIPTVSDLVQPMTDGKALSISKTWVSDKQILRMVQRTPKEHIYKRPAKGGGEWSYVTGTYVEKVLNFVFGFLWDFEVLDHGKEGDQVWVKGKLTVKNPAGSSIIKTQFGRADIKMKKTGGMLDYGNDLKAATTDALKKCASLLGIASDIYGKAEFKQETGKDIPESRPMISEPTIKQGDASPTEKKTLKKGQSHGPDNEPVYLCSVTGEIISDAEGEFSMKMFGRPLSREAQKTAKRK